MNSKTTFIRRCIAVLGKPQFFWAIVALFVVQAVWIALSARYPMAFDEDFHLGIIRIYADHVNPFLANSPPHTEVYGAIARDPSYLYQYLMSFPYKFIRLFTDSVSAQVLFLRAINIALFALSLPLFKRILLKTGASKALVNGCLLLFVLLPIAPLLAGQINYDNLFIPFTALCVLATLNITEQISRKNKISSSALLLLIAAVMTGSLIKYAFLPIGLVLVVFTTVIIIRKQRSIGEFWKQCKASFVGLTVVRQVVLIVVVLLASVLFAQRYAVNLVQYHQPIPECSKVLSVRQCSAYAPWQRDYRLAQAKQQSGVTASHSPFTFSADWFYGMWLRTFFAVDGPTSNFATRGPLLLPAVAAIVASASSVVLLGFYAKAIFRRYNQPTLWLFIAISAGYIVALWLDEFKAFVKTDHVVAINGRYLLVIYPLLFLLGALAWRELLRKSDRLKLLILSLAILSMIWGGGALTYILRSNDSWYWSNSTIRRFNADVRHYIGPVVPGYNKGSLFMSRN